MKFLGEPSRDTGTRELHRNGKSRQNHHAFSHWHCPSRPQSQLGTKWRPFQVHRQLSEWFLSFQSTPCTLLTSSVCLVCKPLHQLSEASRSIQYSSQRHRLLIHPFDRLYLYRSHRRFPPCPGKHWLYLEMIFSLCRCPHFFLICPGYFALAAATMLFLFLLHHFCTDTARRAPDGGSSGGCSYHTFSDR